MDVAGTSSNLARPFELPEPERRRGRSFPGLGQDFDHSRQEVRPEARHELCRGRISCRDLEDTGADGFQDTDAVSNNLFGHFFSANVAFSGVSSVIH